MVTSREISAWTASRPPRMKIGNTFIPYFSNERERCAAQRKPVDPPSAYGTRTSLSGLDCASRNDGRIRTVLARVESIAKNSFTYPPSRKLPRSGQLELRHPGQAQREPDPGEVTWISAFAEMTIQRSRRDSSVKQASS